MDVLRLLCWCQNVRPDDLSSISTETERENLITLGLIKRHQRSDTLLLTNSGKAFLQAALEGDVPNLTLSYHDAAIERRVRLSALMMTAYHAGINVFTITANSLAEPSTLFITAITRSRGHNPWGSARVGAIAHLGSTYYAVHYIYSGIGRMAVNDELAAFHNHTNFGKDTQRAFLFAGASYADIIEELKVRDEKRDTKLIRYSEAYGNVLTPALFEYKKQQYPDGVGNYADFIKDHWLGRRTADCIGLIKGYGWLDTKSMTIRYATNGMPDYGADQMYQACKNAGTLNKDYGTVSTMPEIPGLMLWKSGHAGVYIGGGYAIEAMGTSKGVVKTKVSDRNWQGWGKLPYIDYREGN